MAPPSTSSFLLSEFLPLNWFPARFPPSLFSVLNFLIFQPTRMTSLLNLCSFLLTLLALFTAAARAQTPVGDLTKPPADAEHLIISSTGGKHGDSWIWQTPDGTRMSRERMNLRGQVFETDSATKFGTEGLPTSVTVRGFTPNGDAGEKFTIADGKANWKSPIDAGGAPYLAPSFYIAFGGPMQLNAQFVERLIAVRTKR